MSRVASRRDIVRVVARQLVDEPQEHPAIIRRLAAYMVAHKLVGKADQLLNDLAHELQVQAGLLTAEVVSARQLSDEVRQAISDLLQRQTGAETVVLHETTDQALLGGFVARTPDAEIDASVRTKLKKLSALA